jgi:hypothetical protein
MVFTFLLLLLLLQIAVEAVSVKLIPDSGTPPSYRDYPGITFSDYENKLYILGDIMPLLKMICGSSI